MLHHQLLHDLILPSLPLLLRLHSRIYLLLSNLLIDHLFEHLVSIPEILLLSLICRREIVRCLGESVCQSQLFKLGQDSGTQIILLMTLLRSKHLCQSEKIERAITIVSS